MNQHVADRLRFLRAFVANPRQVGAVLPTSRYAVRDMLDLGDVPGAGLVVELGAGTGSQTAEVLARMKPDARLVALEIDLNLAKLLKERFDDPRVQVVCDSAENLHDHLGGQKVDVLVCALPFTSLARAAPADPRGAAAGAAERRRPGHPVLPLIQKELRRLFGSVQRRISIWNAPAFLFACSQDGAAPTP